MKNFCIAISVLIFCFIETSAIAQLMSAPVVIKKEKSSAPKKAVKKKQIVKFKEDTDDEKPEPVAVDNTTAVPDFFAFLNIKSNKGSAISVTLNDTALGKIKAGKFKKIEVDNGDVINLVLDDGQSHTLDTTLFIGDKDLGKTFIIEFPEIDYAAIKRGELEIKETAIAPLVEKAIEYTTALKTYHGKIKNGEIDLNAQEVSATFTNATASVKELNAAFAEYDEVAKGFGFVERKETFIRTTKNKLEDGYRSMAAFSSFSEEVKNNKRPMSASFDVVLASGRQSDMPFYITAVNVNDTMSNGALPLFYALEKKAHASIIDYLIKTGAVVNYFGKRFPEDKTIFATPLAYASIYSDTNVVKVLVNANAQFYPTGYTKKENQLQMKVLLQKFKDRQDVLALLKRYNYDLDDGTAIILQTLNSIENNMVLLQGDTLTLGCLTGDKDCGGDESPTIKLFVDTFYISKFELTQSQWFAILENNPSQNQNCPDCPVEGVNFEDIQKFIIRINELSGKKYRLPTEVEWEFAAKDGVNKSTFLYAGNNNIDSVAWYKNNSNAKTNPVGSKAPNLLGLYDMSGNVCEWTNSTHTENLTPYQNSANTMAGSQKVIRGGSWAQSNWSSRITNRENSNPLIISDRYGFRLAIDADATK